MGGVNSIAASPEMLRRSAPQHKLRHARVHPERSEGSPVAHQGSNQVSWAGSTASLHQPEMLRRSAPQHKLRRVYPERSEGSPVAHQGSNQVSWAGSTASLHHRRCFVAPLLSINFGTQEFILSEAKDLRWHTKDLTKCHGRGQQHRCINRRCFVAPLLSINFEEFILSEAKDLRWHTKDLTRCHGRGQQHRCITGDASSLRSSA